MPRGVQQCDFQMLGGKQRLLGENGDTPLPFQNVGIQIGVSVIYPAQRPAAAAAIKECFGKCCLSRVHMSQQTSTNMRFFGLFTHARHPLKWFHAGIIA